MAHEENEVDSFDWFWKIIAGAHADRNRLGELLSGMQRDEIVRFNEKFLDAASELTDAPYTDNVSEPSDDGIQDVAEWVVSQGKQYYFHVLKNPDQMPATVERGTGTTFSSVADNVFWERFGQSIPTSY